MIVVMDFTSKAVRHVPISDRSTYFACGFPDEDEGYDHLDEVPAVDVNDL